MAISIRTAQREDCHAMMKLIHESYNAKLDAEWINVSLNFDD